MSIILQLTTVHPRNDTRIFFREANTLAANLKNTVILMVADGKGNINNENGKVSIRDLGLLPGGRLGRVLIGSTRAFIEIMRMKPDIVHFHDPELITLGVLLRMIGLMVIYDVHEDVPRQVFSKYYIPRLLRYPIAMTIAILEWFCAKLWTAIIPATPIIAATPVIAGRFPEKKTIVVHNFPSIDEIKIEKSILYTSRNNSFAYIGGIEKVRGAFEMVKALECLKGIVDARIELAGWFSPANLQDELKVMGGWSMVNYHGSVDRSQIAKILSGVRAGLVVLHPEPTHIESYAIKMFEYMCAGLPVIASDFPLWRRIIDGCGCGLLVDPMNPNSIAEAMHWIIEHPDKAEAMGKRGREAVENTYNWTSEAARLLSLYRTLLARLK